MGCLKAKQSMTGFFVVSRNVICYRLYHCRIVIEGLYIKVEFLAQKYEFRRQKIDQKIIRHREFSLD